MILKAKNRMLKKPSSLHVTIHGSAESSKGELGEEAKARRKRTGVDTWMGSNGRKEKERNIAVKFS